MQHIKNPLSHLPIGASSLEEVDDDKFRKGTLPVLICWMLEWMDVKDLAHNRHNNIIMKIMLIIFSIFYSRES